MAFEVLKHSVNMVDLPDMKILLTEEAFSSALGVSLARGWVVELSMKFIPE